MTFAQFKSYWLKHGQIVAETMAEQRKVPIHQIYAWGVYMYQAMEN